MYIFLNPAQYEAIIFNYHVLGQIQQASVFHFEFVKFYAKRMKEIKDIQRLVPDVAVKRDLSVSMLEASG